MLHPTPLVSEIITSGSPVSASQPPEIKYKTIGAFVNEILISALSSGVSGVVYVFLQQGIIKKIMNPISIDFFIFPPL